MHLLRKLQRPLQIAFGVIAVAFLVYFVARNWGDVAAALGRMNPAWVAASFVLGLVGNYFQMLNWRSLVHAFGFGLGVRKAAEMTFIAQIGKYIPGGVWPTVVASQLGASAGIPASSVAVTMIMQMGVQLTTATVLAVGSLLLVPALAHEYWWLILLVLVIGVVALLPPVMRRILGVLFGLMRRREHLPELRGGKLGLSIVWSLLGYIMWGLHLWLLFGAIDGLSARTFIPSVSGFSLAWAVGFLAVLAPAGAGVREGILVLLFSGIYGAAVVLGVAVVSRILLVVVDVVSLCYGLLLRALDRRARPEPASSAVGSERP